MFELAIPYLLAGAMATWSPDTSNSDRVEFGTETGQAIDFGVGIRYPFAGLRIEGVFSYLPKDLHGENHGNIHKSADGKRFDAVNVGILVLPELHLGSGFSVYAGGGVGFGAIDVCAPSLTAAAGVTYDITDRVFVDGGYRYTIIGDYDLHMARVGVGWKF